MNAAEQLAKTLELMKAAQATPDQLLNKAFTQSGSATTGLTYYDLEAPAKTLYPVMVPLRNRIPRVSGKGGIQANWRAITGININAVNAGVGQGNRGGVIATSTAEYNAAYKGLGLEDYVTFEADYSAEGFDDVRARAVEGLLRSLMIQEERVILGGNNSVALGTCPTPTAAAVTTGGALADATYKVYCVALTLEAYLNSSVSGGIPTGAVTRTNADGSTDTYGPGTSKKSAVATAVLSGGSGAGRVTAYVTPVDGAVAYAWFWGESGSELLGAITTINSVNATAAATGTQNASAVGAADASTNDLVYDGLLSQIMKSGSGAYVYEMATGTPGTGTPLTADGYGGIVEIDAALKSFWDNYRLTPTEIIVGAQELMNISSKVLAGTSNAAHNFTFAVDQSMIGGGVMVRSYLNKFGMAGPTSIPISLHPNMPPGTIMFYSDATPYPLSNVPQILRILTRREYYQIEWPLRSRKYEYGVYADEVLQNYFPPAFGLIRNIANG